MRFVFSQNAIVYHRTGANMTQKAIMLIENLRIIILMIVVIIVISRIVIAIQKITLAIKYC